MEVFERVRYLRKGILKMSMNQFGEKLGVSRDVISNIEGNRLARPDQKLSLMKLICEKFKVREEWLLHGEEPMSVEELNTFNLNDLLREEGVKEEYMELVKSIVHMYIDLKPETQKDIYDKFSKYIMSKKEKKSNTAGSNNGIRQDK